jgi:hypothetical protein
LDYASGLASRARHFEHLIGENCDVDLYKATTLAIKREERFLQESVATAADCHVSREAAFAFSFVL